MTVNELIEELRKYPGDMLVVTPIDTGDYEVVCDAVIEERFCREEGSSRFFDESMVEYLSLENEVKAVKVVQIS